MEDRKAHRIPRVLGLTLAAFLLATSAGADGHFSWPTDIVVQTGSDAVVVEADTGGSIPGGTGTQASGGSNCYAEGPGNIGTASIDLVDQSNSFPYALVCDGEIVGVVWLPIDGGGGGADPTLSPRDIAMSLRERIPIPNVTLRINPERGLVGVESWFWIEGYDGEPITESTDAFGREVEVEARVKRYEWRFGDGAGLVSRGPGTAYPERSEVRHVYERSSRGQPNGYRVEVGFVFSVRYRVGGGGWIDLPGIERVAEAFYPVQESQAVIRR